MPYPSNLDWLAKAIGGMGIVYNSKVGLRK